MKVKAYAVREEIVVDAGLRKRLPRLSFDELQAHKALRRGWISTVCMAYEARSGLLYCGLTAFDNDLLYAFDVQAKTFRSLGFQAVADRFDVKIHRSLEIAGNGVVYGATACLHDIDQQEQAAGGKLFCYDPALERYQVLGIPIPRQYIQTILLDEQRRCLYGFTYPVTHAFRFDLDTGQSHDLGYTGYDPHSPVIDDRGVLWGVWKQSLAVGPVASLWSYDPATGRAAWHRSLGLPRLLPGDIGYPDSALNGQDGFLYFGTNQGALARLDPRTLEVTFLGRPLASPRLPGLVVGQDGRLYGCGGDSGETYLFAYDRDSRRSTILGRIFDPQRQAACGCTHWLVETRPGLFYVGETDNHYRSGYLWECDIT